MVEKTTVITIGLVITVFLFLMMLLLIAMILFRGEDLDKYKWRTQKRWWKN